MFFFVFGCLLYFHYFSFNFLLLFSPGPFFFSFSFILRGVRPPCFREVKRFNSCISQTVIFVHCAITFQATSLFCLSFLVHFWAEPRVFYTVSIYNLATIGRRRSQQGIYNDDAGHIGWPFVYVLGASSLFDSGSEIRPSIGRAPQHIWKWSCEGRIAMWRRLDAMSVTNYCCKSQDCSVNNMRNLVTKTSTIVASG